MMRAVDETLKAVGAGDRPRLLVLNKGDAIDAERRLELLFAHPDGMLISAATGEGLEELGERIEEEFRRSLRSVDLLLPYAEGARLAELHDVAGDLERTDTPTACACTPACRRRWPSATSASRSTARRPSERLTRPGRRRRTAA